MKARDLLRLVWANLRRMKARVAMTAIGVVIGTAAVIVLISLAAGLQRTATEGVGSIGDLTEITVISRTFIRAMGGSAGPGGEEAVLDDHTLREIRDLPGVVAATPREQLMGGGTLRLNRLLGGAQIEGIDPTQVEGLDFALASGMGRLGRWQALVGARLAEGFS
jgi:putative ABC transport system permease protein